MARKNTEYKSIAHTPNIGIGVIIVPQNVDRNEFVDNCLRKQKVSILVSRGGGVIHNCPISIPVLREISFPLDKNKESESYKKFGSSVFFFIEPIHGTPIITGILSKDSESLLLRENEFEVIKSHKGCKTSFQMSPNENIVNINISNKGKPTKINIISDGSTDSEIRLVTSGNVVLSGENLKLNKSKLTLFKGESPIPKGDVLKSELTKMKEVVDGIVSVINGTPIPEPGNLGNSVFQSTLKLKIAGKVNGKFEGINSKKSFHE